MFPRHYVSGWRGAKIRKYLADNNFVDTVVQLPTNLFLNVSISVDIMVLRKNKTDNAVLFIDASGEFVEVTKNNCLSDANINCTVSSVAKRKDEKYFSRLVPNVEVGNEYNNYFQDGFYTTYRICRLVCCRVWTD